MTPFAGTPDALRLPTPKSRIAASIVTISCADSSWGFTTLRPEWNSLLHESAADCPFLTWEWLHSWWTHVGRASTLRIAAVRADGQLIALAPFCLTPGVLPRLDMLGTGEAGSDYLDVIIRRGYEREALPALERFFYAQSLPLRLTHLSQAAAAGDIATRLVASGWHAETTHGGTCPYIPLAGHTWESFLGTLGSSHRANVRRRIRALEQKFDMSFTRVTTQAERHEALAAVIAWHKRRFVARGTAFMNDALRAFHDEVTRRTVDEGWLRLFVLRLNGAPVAVMYGFLYGGTFYFFQHGFDDRYQQHSVGLVLMALSIRAAIEEHAQEFDMLWGTEPYKSLWARDARELRNIQLFPPTIGGLVQRGVFHARRTAGSLARRMRATVNHHGA
jgi:CelD/BcsL family acetyltransferase involved in cellulose biosynthesis